MIKGKKKIVVAIFLLFLVLFPFSINVYAEINHEYSSNNPVQEGDLDGKMKNSIILEAIASMVYAVASWVESLVGAAFQMLTGANMFPWADRVIFNTIPFLDVNFLNPANGSLFETTSGDSTPLANIVVSLYSTVFTLAVTFLGIVVGLMAIKLAVSSLASEKAKYKEALMKFLFSLVALFGMHYAMSFIFYINESLVEMASSILEKNLEGTQIALDLEIDNSVVVENFVKSNPAPNAWQNAFTAAITLGGSVIPQVASAVTNGTVDEFLLDNNGEDDSPASSVSNMAIAGELLNNTKYRRYRLEYAHGNDTNQGIVGWARYLDMFNLSETEAKLLLAADIGTIKDEQEYQKVVDYYNEFKDIDMNNPNKQELTNQIKNTDFYKNLLSNPEGVYDLIKKFLTEDLWGQITSALDNLKNQVLNFFGWSSGNSQNVTDDTMALYIGQVAKEYQENLWKPMINTHEVLFEGKENKSDPKDLISNMGEFFKRSAWTYETNEDGEITGWVASQVTLQGAILYAMFIVQSIMFFFAYLKRFFYVVILAMLAPVIVVYDFLGKVMS